MKIRCTHCGAKGHTNDDHIGKELLCPQCHGRFLAQVQSETVTESLISTQPSENTIDSLAGEIAERPEPAEKQTTPLKRGMAEPLMDVEEIEFSFRSLCREAWTRTKGVKSAIWAALGVMSLTMFIVRLASTMILPEDGVLAVSVEVALSVVSSFFVTSLAYMGLLVARDQPLHWKMIFTSFSCWRRLIVTCCLQWFFIVLGFLLLILPGIYLSIGYAYAMLLVLDKDMSPWQAMEVSRKVIHKIWWKMFGLYVLVGLVMFLAAIPLGIGLIWCVPWSLVLMGVLYHFLFDVSVESV